MHVIGLALLSACTSPDEMLLEAVNAWDAGVQATVAQVATAELTETQLATARQASPWLEDVYVWKTDGEASLVFPKPRPERADVAMPCIDAGIEAARTSDLSRAELAALFIDGCRDAPFAVRHRAAREAGALQKESPEAVLAALDTVPEAVELTIAEAVDKGVEPADQVKYGVQRARALFELRRVDEAVALEVRLAEEILDPSAPRLLVEPLYESLQWGLLHDLGKVDRQLDGYGTFLRRDKVLKKTRKLMKDDSPRSGSTWEHDPTPLVQVWTVGDGTGSAVGLVPDALFESLQAATEQRVFVSDSKGKVVYGDNDGEVVARVEPKGLLRGYRVVSQR